MLVLISSGAQRRYADDIVRALAHPAGTEFQFRYGSQYIDPGLLGRIGGGLVGEAALICYLAADATARTAKLIPCRFVRIAGTQLLGTSCIFTLEAAAFPKTLDDATLRSRMTAPEVNKIPSFEPGGTHAQGAYAFEIAVPLATDKKLVSSDSDAVAAFEGVATALSADPQFDTTSKRAFFTVREIATTDHWLWAKPVRRPVKLKEGRYALKSGMRYVADVYSFSPTGGAVTAGSTKLGIDSDEKDVRFTSNKLAVLDSRYDLNRFAFATDQRVLGLPAGLRFALHMPSDADPKMIDQRCDITLETRFAGSFWLGAARVVVIGLGAALPAVIAAWKSVPATATPAAAVGIQPGTILLMVLAGCIAGLGTVIPSLKKN